MRIQQLNKNYSRLNEANLGSMAQNIVHSLTDNPYFPLTDPSLEKITAAKDAYLLARENASNGGKTEIVLKNQAREALLDELFLLATNLESLAKGDRAKLASTGYVLTKTAESRPPIVGPLIVNLTDGNNPGELKIVVIPLPNVVSYNYEHTLAPLTNESIWITKPSTDKQCTLTGLPSGSKAYVRVAAIGRKNQELYSMVYSRMVQ